VVLREEPSVPAPTSCDDFGGERRGDLIITPTEPARTIEAPTSCSLPIILGGSDAHIGGSVVGAIDMAPTQAEP
jgi:hypothetical protein